MSNFVLVVTKIDRNGLNEEPSKPRASRRQSATLGQFYMLLLTSTGEDTIQAKSFENKAMKGEACKANFL